MRQRKKLLLQDLQEKSVDVTKKTKTTPTRSSPRESVDVTKKTKSIPTRSSPRKSVERKLQVCFNITKYSLAIITKINHLTSFI